jgi:hypothetical protein
MIGTSGVDEYDLRKNRKMDPYHGKTTRVKSGIHDGCAREMVLAHGTIISKDGMMTVTRVDELIGTFNNKDKCLGRAKLWDSVLEEMNRSAAEKTSQFDARSGQMVTKYEIPVVAHTVIGGTDEKALSTTSGGRRWLSWKGVSYDPSKLYVVNNNGPGTPERLKAVCSLAEAPTKFPDDRFIHPIAFKVSTTTSNKHQFRNPGQYAIPTCTSAFAHSHWVGNASSSTTPVAQTLENGLSSAIVMDLKAVHLVTHLAFRGEQPTTILFPKEFYNKSKKYSNSDDRSHNGIFGSKFLRRQGSGGRRGRKGRRKEACVQVLCRPPTELPHVTSFDLYEKDLVSGRWLLTADNIRVAPTHHGISSTVVDLKAAGAFNCGAGLRSRFIKLIPTSWHISPVFRVMVYGKEFASSTNSASLRAGMLNEVDEAPDSRRKLTRRQERRESSCEVARLAEVPVETRTYTLYPASTGASWKLDGKWRSYNDYYYDYCRTLHEQARYIRDCMKDTEYF